MSTEFCSQCKQSHPGRPCDYNDQGDCAETLPQPEKPTEESAPAKKATAQRRPAIDGG